MTTILEYKGYCGSAEVSVADQVIHGRLLFIRDVVSYVAESATDIQAAFEEAVDDYLATCVECGDAPDKPFKGVFNVRIGSELHRDCALSAAKLGQKLNEWVKLALEMRLASEATVSSDPVTISITNHTHHHHHRGSDSRFVEESSDFKTEATWQQASLTH